MGRQPRICFPGAIFHVMERGLDRGPIFFDDHDRRDFMSDLERVVKSYGADLIAHCLMTNHYHMAIKVGAVPLSKLMQRLLTSYAKKCNRRRARVGHLFDARYKAKLCHTDAYLANVIKYIHFNPVRAGLVSSPREWPWSSAPRFGELADDPGDFDPWADIGTEGILLRGEAPPTETIEDISTRLATAAGFPGDSARVMTKRRDVVELRREVARVACAQGHSMTAIASWLGTSVSSVSKYCRRECSNVEA